MTRLAFTIFLALILSGSTQAVPQPIVVRPPAGITIHLTQSGIFIDANGTIFAKTRASSDRGDIVWKVQDGQSVIVLEPGPEAARGNGYLTVLQGRCVLVTANASNQIVGYDIPGCTP